MQVLEGCPLSCPIILPSIILCPNEKTCRFVISPSLALQAWMLRTITKTEHLFLSHPQACSPSTSRVVSLYLPRTGCRPMQSLLVTCCFETNQSIIRGGNLDTIRQQRSASAKSGSHVITRHHNPDGKRRFESADSAAFFLLRIPKEMSPPRPRSVSFA